MFVLFLLAFTFVLNLLLAIISIFRSNLKKERLLFFLSAFFISIVSLIDIILRLNPNTFILRLAFFFTLFIVLFLYLWVKKSFNIKLSKKLNIFIYLNFIILIIIVISTDIIIKNYNFLTDLGCNTEFGKLFPYYIFFICLIASILIFSLIKKYLIAKKPIKNQLFYILLGIVLYFLFGGIFSLWLPYFFDYYKLTALDIPSSIFFSLFSLYAIKRYRLLGIRFFIRKIYIYTLLIVFSFVFITLLQFFLIQNNLLNMKGLITINFIFSIIFSLSFIYFYKKIEHSGDDIFFQESAPKKIITKFTQDIANISRPKNLYQYLNEKLQKIIDCNKISIIVVNNNKKDQKNSFNSDNLNSNLTKYLIKNYNSNDLFCLDILNNPDKNNSIKNLNKKIKIILPLYSKNLFGFLIIYNKQNSEIYNKEDIEFLKNIHQRTADSIKNALMFKKLKNNNFDLKSKAESNKIEKNLQNINFEQIGKLASGILHDISNPLTSLSLNIRSLKNYKFSEFSEAKKDIDNLMDTTKKMQNFINSVQKQIKNQEEKTNFSPNQEIKETLNLYSYKLKKEKISLEINLKSNKKLFANSVKFNQIIANLISNSIDAFDKNNKNNKITIETYDKKNIIIIIIKDNGRGIKQENLNKIFEDRFTTKNQQKGTGIGLYFVDKIIRNDFKGDIKVSSIENLGTRFRIEL